MTSVSYLVVGGPPTAQVASPASGGTYTVGQVVGASFNCSDATAGPGLTSCDDSNGTSTTSGGTGKLDTATTGAHTYTVTATSMDGLTGTASISYTVTATPLASHAKLGAVRVKGTTVLARVSCSKGAPCRVKLVLTDSETLSHGNVVAVAAGRSTRKLIVGGAQATIPGGVPERSRSPSTRQVGHS